MSKIKGLSESHQLWFDGIDVTMLISLSFLPIPNLENRPSPKNRMPRLFLQLLNERHAAINNLRNAPGAVPMADFRYFAEVDGEAVQLSGIWHVSGSGRLARHFSGLTPAGVRVLADRMVIRKAAPSNHECDARCMGATGRTMQCECRCGGKNHGRGFRAEAVAA